MILCFVCLFSFKGGWAGSPLLVSLGLPCVPIRSVVGWVGGWVFLVVLLLLTSFASPLFGYLDCLKNKNSICNFQMATFLDLEITVVAKVSDFSCTMLQ